MKRAVSFSLGANQVLTMIPNSEVGTARRAVHSRLGEATLPQESSKADLRPFLATHLYSALLT